MTREAVSALIHWPMIIWVVGIVNVSAMLPQLVKLIRTHETKGLSLGTVWIFFGTQTALSLEGYFTRNAMLMWCLGLSACVSAMVISLVTYYRRTGV